MSPELNVAVLISIGLHPKSGRSHRADQDARAVEMALNLCTAPRVVHAGNSQEAALRSYIGMGLTELTVLESSEQDAIAATLVAYLRAQPMQLILTGTRAERGQGSGLLPYSIAEQLGWPIVSQVVTVLKVEHKRIEVLQALPRGQRRKIAVSLPCILSVDSTAQAPRQSAYGLARRGQIKCLSYAQCRQEKRPATWHYKPAQKRPKRIKKINAKTALARFKAATAKAQTPGGKILSSQSADEKAQAILDFLHTEGVLK